MLRIVLNSFGASVIKQVVVVFLCGGKKKKEACMCAMLLVTFYKESFPSLSCII